MVLVIAITPYPLFNLGGLLVWLLTHKQTNKEPTSCNLNSGGDGQRNTRTDLKRMQDRQAQRAITAAAGGP